MLRAEGKSPATIRDRGRCLRRLHEDLPCGWVFACREQLVAWLGYEEWSPATRRAYTGHVLGGYAWLYEHGHISLNPALGIRRPRVPRKEIRIVSDDQLAIALTAPEPLLTAVMLANYQGLRRAEAAACRREDITEEVTTIRRAKGGETQTVPTHPAVWEHVKDRPRGPLVTGMDGEELTAEQLGALARRWFLRAGLTEVTRDGRVLVVGLHHFRRRYGTLIQRLHRNIRITQECLRHKSVTTTADAYAKVTDDECRDAVRSLPWLKHRPDGGRPVPPAQSA